MLCVSLDSLLQELYCFTAFAKKTSRIERNADVIAIVTVCCRLPSLAPGQRLPRPLRRARGVRVAVHDHRRRVAHDRHPTAEAQRANLLECARLMHTWGEDPRLFAFLESNTLNNEYIKTSSI